MVNNLMKLLCRNNQTVVYDDGDFYFVKSKGRADEYIPKAEQKAYPLACCLKWGMEPVDIEYLNALSNELQNGQKVHLTVSE